MALASCSTVSVHHGTGGAREVFGATRLTEFADVARSLGATVEHNNCLKTRELHLDPGALLSWLDELIDRHAPTLILAPGPVVPSEPRRGQPRRRRRPGAWPRTRGQGARLVRNPLVPRRDRRGAAPWRFHGSTVGRRGGWPDLGIGQGGWEPSRVDAVGTDSERSSSPVEHEIAIRIMPCRSNSLAVPKRAAGAPTMAIAGVAARPPRTPTSRL
jgi:hypothetical protein